MPLAWLLRAVFCERNRVEALTSPGGWGCHEAQRQLGLRPGGDVSSLHFGKADSQQRHFHGLFSLLKNIQRASLVAQQERICLPVQETRVHSLMWEDPT